jgi:choline dehydrogenase-like flavoprotein
VLDGSIVPGSLGSNPCLTIAALAEKASLELAKAWELRAAR